MKANVTSIVLSILCMIVLTFLYLMAQIKESPVPTAVSIIYGTSLGVQVILVIYNAIKLDIRLKKLADKFDDLNPYI